MSNYSFAQSRPSTKMLARIHETFNGLTKKDLALLSASPPGRTDTVSFIAIAPEDPDAALILKHEWSHVIFKTNLYALWKFADQYMMELVRDYNVDREQALEVIHAVCNALDDIRVNSLWAIPYPHSSFRIEERWRAICADKPSTHYIIRIIAIGVDADLANGHRVFDTLASEAVANVRQRGYSAVLRNCKHLISHLIEHQIARDYSPLLDSNVNEAPKEISKRAVATKALQRIGYQADKASFIYDLQKAPTSPDVDPEGTDKMVRMAMLEETSSLAIEASLDAEAQEVRTIAQQLDGQRLIKEDRLLEDNPNVSLIDVKPGTIRHSQMNDHDIELIELLRSMFSKHLGMRRRRVEAEGTDLDPERLIDMQVGSGDSRIFRDEVIARGFNCLLLIDMSGSMADKWSLVERACRVLAYAMKFPFTQVSVWGFSETATGTTHIFRFADPSWGISPPTGTGGAWGMTPIHTVLPISTKELLRYNGHRHIILVSDGTPQAVGADNSAMRATVKKAREDGEGLGVHYSVLLVGHSTPAELADYMYGARGWIRTPDDSYLFDGLVSLVSKIFDHYLRG
jgi:hypothetical protein